MTLEEVKQYICEAGYEDAIVLDSPDYADAFAGLTHDGRAVYNWVRMVECLMTEDGMDMEEAMEFIAYNTERALPYMGDRAPVILYPADEE